MATEVVMPQMGESIAEGTIVRWIKKVGDAVDRDEPLFEISTDKVDAEIPSPVAGVLTEIKAQAGETVAVNSVVATIGKAGEAPAAPAPRSAPTSVVPGKEKAAASAQPQADGTPTAAAPSAGEPAEAGPHVGSQAGPHVGSQAGPHGASRVPATAAPSGNGGQGELTKDDLRRQKSSPLVRRIAREHNVDIAQIAGSGIGGRVTKHDILDYLEGSSGAQGSLGAGAQGSAERRERHEPEPQAPLAPRAPQEPGSGSRIEIQPLSVMRKKIAEHMVMSRRTSAHVHSVFHVNFSALSRIRQQKKDEYERRDTKLTYMSFIAKAAIDAIRRHPIINSSLDGDNVVYKKDVNLGIAVALENGLIVPVIRHADEKNMLGLSRAIADLAARARSKQLKPEEVQGGTFTITNPGTFGAQFGMPIINQPQVAILGVGIIEKRPVVVDDAIAIRTMAYLTLGYDHRLIDGAVADEFMADIKQQIENFDPSAV